MPQTVAAHSCNESKSRGVRSSKFTTLVLVKDAVKASATGLVVVVVAAMNKRKRSFEIIIVVGNHISQLSYFDGWREVETRTVRNEERFFEKREVGINVRTMTSVTFGQSRILLLNFISTMSSHGFSPIWYHTLLCIFAFDYSSLPTR